MCRRGCRGRICPRGECPGGCSTLLHTAVLSGATSCVQSVSRRSHNLHTASSPTLTAVLPRGAALHRRRCGRSSLAGRQCQCHCVYRRSIERRRRVQSIHVRSLATPVGLQLTSTAIYSAIAATFSLDLVHSQDQLTDRQISLRVSINI